MRGLGLTRTRVAVASTLVVVALAGVGLLAVPDLVLVVERTDTGEVVLEQRVSNGTTVALTYVHSVEKSRVYDGYTVRGRALEMTRMEFESYGWGLPARANVTHQNGTLVYDPPGTFAELTVSPGRIAGHELHVGDRTYDLVELAGGSSVRLTLERRTPLESMV